MVTMTIMMKESFILQSWLPTLVALCLKKYNEIYSDEQVNHRFWKKRPPSWQFIYPKEKKGITESLFVLKGIFQLNNTVPFVNTDVSFKDCFSEV